MKRSHAKKSRELESEVLLIQKHLSYVLLFFFFLLLIANLVDAQRYEQTTALFLSIISGWIGLILGLYFGKGMSTQLERSLRQKKKTSRSKSGTGKSLRSPESRPSP